MKKLIPKKFFDWAFLTLCVFFITFTASYISHEIRMYRTLELHHWFMPPELRNTNGEIQNEFSAGDPFLITYYIDRQPLGCWATYIDVIDGPVSYQFPPQRSQLVVDKRTKFIKSFYKELPDNLPPGKYTWKQITYPICDSISLDPIIQNTDLILTVSQ